MNTATARVIVLQPTQDFSARATLLLNPTATELPRLPASVRKIAEFFDGHRSFNTVCDLARISEAKGRAIVRKLTDLRILTSATSAASAPRVKPRVRATTPFTALEENFFASEVAPIDECDLPFESFTEKLRRALATLVSA
ncbi:MAG: hypothetical protein KAI47_16595 [Deltaproteobacteria bacterium]|nr:hypothetical protein [Deltaproteobacteria bacterium]